MENIQETLTINIDAKNIVVKVLDHNQIYKDLDAATAYHQILNTAFGENWLQKKETLKVAFDLQKLSFKQSISFSPKLEDIAFDDIELDLQVMPSTKTDAFLWYKLCLKMH